MPRPSAFMFVLFGIVVLAAMTNGIAILLGLAYLIGKWCYNLYRYGAIRYVLLPELEVERELRVLEYELAEIAADARRFPTFAKVFGHEKAMHRKYDKLVAKWKYYDDKRIERFEALKQREPTPNEVPSMGVIVEQWAKRKGL